MTFVDYFNEVVNQSNKFTNYNLITHVRSSIKNRFVFKYMDIDTAINYCLQVGNNSIQFVQPTQWVDKYEGRFYNAAYYNIMSSSDYAEKIPRLFACCFTTAKTSEAAWKTYSYNKSGRGAECVQFKINVKKLRTVLNTYASTRYEVYEGPVLYKEDYEISNLHFKTINGNTNVAYQACFHGFSRMKYLALLLLKRNAFEYEKEVRYFLVPKDQNALTGKHYVPIKFADIVEGVKIAESCPLQYEQDLRAALDANGMNAIPIERFDLYMKNAPRIKIGDVR